MYTTHNNEPITSWYYHHLLDFNERKAYKKLLEAYQKYQSEVMIDLPYNKDRFRKIRSAIQCDYPEIYYVHNTFEYNAYPNKTKFIIHYSFSISNIKEYNRRLNNIANSLAKKAAHLDVYEQIKLIYDYLIDNIEYCDGEYKYEQTIIGALIYGKCVCSGYAQAMAYLLQRLNMVCVKVRGYANSNKYQLYQRREQDKHALNMIQFGSEYYYFDATWGDSENKKINIRMPLLRYKTFGMTSTQLQNYFISLYEGNTPYCNSMVLNYFYHNQIYFKSVNEYQLRILINNAKYGNRFALIFQCANSSIYNQILDLLLNNDFYRNLLPQRITYWDLDEHNIIAIIDNN